MDELKETPSEPMSMENWEEKLEESLAGSELKRGQLREGVIIAIRNDGILVDIGSKRDGFVPAEDLEDLEGQTFTVGQDISVVVTQFRDAADGHVELSISQALLQGDWEKAEALLESQEIYEAKVLDANRGGLTVEFGHLRGFIPMSQLIGFSRVRQATERQRRLSALVGEPIMLKVIEVNRRRRRLILSQKSALKEWRAERRQSLLEELENDQVRRGRISQITDFGLFVNLGGLDGLVHISELSWGRIENPTEIYRRGQRIKVKVLNIDRERQRIGLSIKALTPDPWEIAPEKYQEGTLIEGKISQVVDFGVFVELEPGVEGLLHNSELGDMEQRDELTPGQKVLVKIIRVEPNRRRIGLSVRRVRREEWEEWVANKATEEPAALDKPEEDDFDDLDDYDEDEDFGAETEDATVDAEEDAEDAVEEDAADEIEAEDAAEEEAEVETEATVEDSVEAEIEATVEIEAEAEVEAPAAEAVEAADVDNVETVVEADETLSTEDTEPEA